MSRFLVSAAHKSSGKTTVSIGLCAALTARGLTVQAFKKGPDYIDPMWLAQASGRPCFNLDPYLMTSEQISASFSRFSGSADISLVEGNKGLYDGLALDGSNSNAALAQLLDLPVVLVLDARGMTRGIAPLILGYQAFDARIRIAGVILNQLGGSRHEAKLRAVIEHYTNVSVLGAIAHDPQLGLVERHLGLMPNQECDDAVQHVQTIGQRIAEQVDLGQIIALANSASHVIPSAPGSPEALDCGSEPAMTAHPGQPLRLGIMRDKAFGFYYPDDLLALQAAGAELVPVNALQDSALPAVDGLFIGGGFPEVFMPELQANTALRSNIRSAIEAGLPVYAECGGLMYLARTLRWKEQQVDLVGALPVDVLMHERPVGRGYVSLQTTPDAPWLTAPEQAGQTLRGHEFHYSSLENVPPGLKFAYKVQRGHGIDGQRDGLVYRNVLASYSHLRTGASSDWAREFVNFVRRQKMADQTQVAAAPRTVLVKGQSVATDVEGYLKNLEDWSEDFARAQAESEDLTLTAAHWQVIYFLRAYFEEHRVQAQVRAMIPHFARLWGPELGNNHHLHAMFPVGGPQKQGNRLAGLLKTKGEH
ncbi:cobyrinate a,c-diamide synthase [Rhodoferax sp.]|uniref:cobyrinate a,c-diamide synthase n=1 Tax=Rhodoferax sp. TaxID=50421 RepID=UPI0025EF0AF2|nr:cobyrinate a,c-diamide synthase [Rhodoferax sp.]